MVRDPARRAAVDRAAWTKRHGESAAPLPPSPFVVEALTRLSAPRPPARAIDIACGRGRHALLLARHGYAVLAVDWAVPALQGLHRQAQTQGLAISCLAADVSQWTLPGAHYALVLTTNFLERALLPRLRDAVAPGGALLIETFLDGQQRYGHPTNPAHLLRPGELQELCRGWDVRHAHAGTVTHGCRTAMMAGILARRP